MLIHYFCVTRIQLRVRLMSFLQTTNEQKTNHTEEKLTRSSCISLKAETRRTTASGTIVVYCCVGDTPGICCIHAVNRKNKLAYFENCSTKICSAHAYYMGKIARTEQELGQKGCNIVLARSNEVVPKFPVSRTIVQRDDSLSR